MFGGSALTFYMQSIRAVWRHNAVGPVILSARDVHRVSVHASRATPSTCRSSGYRCVREHGDADLTPAGAVGGFDADAACQTLDLEIDPAWLARVAEEIDRPRRALAPQHVVRDARITGLAWALDAEQRAEVPAGPLYADSLATALAVHLLGLHSTIGANGVDDRRLLRVVDYIEAHLDRRLTLAQLAEVAEISSAHLRAWFKARTGLPVHRYVVRRRVERARVLLQQGGRPASEIALAVGFAHQTHMARWLRRELGVTPRELSTR